MEYLTKTEQSRFNSFWKEVDGCHIWQGYLDRDGYGQFYLRKKGRRAHRVGYFFANGPIPDEMVVDHICKNRACVNPAHLKIVTKKENSLVNSNSLGAVNAKKTTCKYGHKFDKIYTNSKTGKSQRICSICEKEKQKRLRKKWMKEANETKC